METKKIQTKVTRQTKKLISNTDNAFNDFIKLLDKYAGSKDNYVISANGSKSKKGFFTLFIKIDDTLPEENRLTLASLGHNILTSDIAAAMAQSLDQLNFEEKNMIEYKA